MLTSASSCKTMRVIWAPCRITPACAGNRVETSHAPPPKKNHPRLRGEQRADTRTVYCSPGSPPLARGTGFLRAPTKSGTGITPACAGNSVGPIGNAQSLGDHPRLRGEQTLDCGRLRRNIGSPPLARGTDGLCRHVNFACRITPACAGNSCCRQSPCR